MLDVLIRPLFYSALGLLARRRSWPRAARRRPRRSPIPIGISGDLYPTLKDWQDSYARTQAAADKLSATRAPWATAPMPCSRPGRGQRSEPRIRAAVRLHLAGLGPGRARRHQPGAQPTGPGAADAPGREDLLDGARDPAASARSKVNAFVAAKQTLRDRFGHYLDNTCARPRTRWGSRPKTCWPPPATCSRNPIPCTASCPTPSCRCPPSSSATARRRDSRSRRTRSIASRPCARTGSWCSTGTGAPGRNSRAPRARC